MGFHPLKTQGKKQHLVGIKIRENLEKLLVFFWNERLHNSSNLEFEGG